MDDLAVVVDAPDYPTLLRKACAITSILLDTCKGFGLTPNTAQGKMEILVQPRGPGTLALSRQLFGASGRPSLPIVCEYGSHEIHVASSYSHLGCLHHHSGRDWHEIRRHIGIANAAFTQNRRLLLHNRQLALPKRVALFESLVLSKLLYGAGAWILDTARSVDQWNSAVHRLYRRLLRCKHDEHLSTTQVRLALGLPSGFLLLRRARLRYLSGLHQPRAQHLWDVIRQDHAWTTACQDDLHWIWCQLQRSSDLPDPEVHHEPWLQLWQAQPKRWKGLIKRAFRHEHLQLQLHQGTQEFHARLHHHFVQAEFLSQDAVPAVPPLEPDDTRYACLPCARSCASQQQDRAHDNLVPVDQAQGPYLLPPPAALPAPWYTCLDDDLAAYLFDLQPNGAFAEQVHALTEGLRDMLRRHPLTWDEGQALLTRLCERFGSEEAELAGLSRTVLHGAVASLAIWTSWDFHLGLKTKPRLPPPDPSSTPSWLALHRGPHEHWCPVPQPMPQEKIVLHLFSGRRRCGNLQYSLEEFAPQLHTGPLVTVSVDIVSDLQWGDVTNPRTRAFWLDAVSRGWVAATIAGPPCETWTVARHRVEADGHGPRPVCSRDFLWGFTQLRLAEASQVLVGNNLLQFAIEVLTVTWLVGHVFLLEHPDLPDRDDAASIWHLPIMQLSLACKESSSIMCRRGSLELIAASPQGCSLSTCQPLHSFWLRGS
eukprot:Skav218747  [mRNA]  locus=scaffold1346:1028527:1030870:- [translate_table: standard]